MTNPQIGEDLAGLAFFALDHAIASVHASGGPLTPFLVTQEFGDQPKKNLHRFVTGTLEGSIVEARRMASELGSEVRFCLLAYDGYMTMDGTRSDAVMVEAMERGDPNSHLFGQRYKHGKWYRRFKSIGNAAYLGVGPALF